MAAVAPRHPDDVAAEDRFAAQLRSARKVARLTQQRVADTAGVEYRCVLTIEHRYVATSRCDTYAAIARALGWRFDLSVIGLQLPDSVHASNLRAMAAGADTWARYDAYTLSALIAQLVVARGSRGWTVSELAARRGVTPWSVQQFEDERSATPMLATLMAHVRALGGVLGPTLVPAVSELEVVA